jgi:hypothetical protein
MVQPYLASVETSGETALLYLGGRYSHAVRKGAMLDGPKDGTAEGGVPDKEDGAPGQGPLGEAAQDALYKPEDIAVREPTAAELAVADRALSLVPGGPHRLLYARVDLIPDDDGEPLLVELELAEPSLYLAYANGAADRFAALIAVHVARNR